MIFRKSIIVFLSLRVIQAWGSGEYASFDTDA